MPAPTCLGLRGVMVIVVVVPSGCSPNLVAMYECFMFFFFKSYLINLLVVLSF